MRSWLAALLGNSFSFLPLRFRQPVAAASSNARSNERFQDAGQAAPNPLPEAPAAPGLPTAKVGTVFSADSNTEAAITQLTPTESVCPTGVRFGCTQAQQLRAAGRDRHGRGYCGHRACARRDMAATAKHWYGQWQRISRSEQ